jgi:hypothetical protein
MVRLSPAPGKSATADVLAAARRRLLQPSACCLLRASAASSRPASCGDKILGTVRGTRTRTRTSGTVRDRLEPPCRRVEWTLTLL